MYFIELIIKKFKKKDKQLKVSNQIDFDYESCEHVFMPIDSTNEMFSCTKCGFIRNKKDLKNKNFFET